MRLIDADALKEALTTGRTFAGPFSVSQIVEADIAILDAAPTVSCGGCNAYVEPHFCNVLHLDATPDFGCVHFERREP